MTRAILVLLAMLLTAGSAFGQAMPSRGTGSTFNPASASLILQQGVLGFSRGKLTVTANTWNGAMELQCAVMLSAAGAPVYDVDNEIPLTLLGATSSIVSIPTLTTGTWDFDMGGCLAVKLTSSTGTTGSISAFLNVIGAGGGSGAGGGGGGGGNVVIQTPLGDSAMDDTNDAVRVNIVAGAAAGGTSQADRATFTAGTTAGTPAQGVFETTRTTLADGRIGMVALTANRSQFTTLEDATGIAAFGPAGTAAAPVLTVQGRAGMTPLSANLFVAGAVNAIGNPAFVTPGTGAVFSSAQSGAWTVQPGNTQNTTAWFTTPFAGSVTAGGAGAANAQTTRVIHATDDPIFARFGEVQASPTANTLLGRLASLETIAGDIRTAAQLIDNAVSGPGFNISLIGGVAPTVPTTFDLDTVGTVNVEGYAIAVAGAGGPVAIPGSATTGLYVDMRARTATPDVNLGSVVPIASTTGGASNFSTGLSTAAVYTNFIKAAPGQVYDLDCFNVGSAPAYARLYNMTTAPASTDTANIVWRGFIPHNTTAGAGLIKSLPVGRIFTTGIALRITSDVADNGTGALSANTVTCNVGFK
jgi:hypothetical protein